LSRKKSQPSDKKKHKKYLAAKVFLSYSLGMELTTTYKGFKFDYQQGHVVFHHPDVEEGNGDWSGSASNL
jgi:hypothetical protein